jgi:hypothetical protein
MMQPNLQPPALTLSILRDSKTFACDCGGKFFEEGMFFKKISPIVSPSGKEEMYPMGVIICKKCGKVPTALNKENLVPQELLASSNISTAM